jgi:pimeloyl-ACP methyl ester carboxylesterase
VTEHLLPVDKAHLHIEWVDSKLRRRIQPAAGLDPPRGTGRGQPLPATAARCHCQPGRGPALYYYDQRGADRSPQAEGEAPPSVSVHVADVDAVRRFIGVEKVRLIGYSWGALLAMLYATQYPQHIDRLVLLSPAPPTAAVRETYQLKMFEALQRPAVQALREEFLAKRDSLSVEEQRRHRFALAVSSYFVEPRRALELTPFLVKQRLETAIWNEPGAGVRSATAAGGASALPDTGHSRRTGCDSDRERRGDGPAAARRACPPARLWTCALHRGAGRAVCRPDPLPGLSGRLAQIVTICAKLRALLLRGEGCAVSRVTRRPRRGRGPR